MGLLSEVGRMWRGSSSACSTTETEGGIKGWWMLIVNKNSKVKEDKPRK